MCRRALCLQGCTHPLHRSEREREKERDREREGERERKREREREKDRERERCRICLELFLFLKRMTGALAPFSYLVKNNNLATTMNIKR